MGSQKVQRKQTKQVENDAFPLTPLLAIPSSANGFKILTEGCFEVGDKAMLYTSVTSPASTVEAPPHIMTCNMVMYLPPSFAVQSWPCAIASAEEDLVVRAPNPHEAVARAFRSVERMTLADLGGRCLALGAVA